MAKLDLRKELKPLYAAPVKAVTFVDADFLAVEGYGHPDNSGQEFQRAIELLYSASFTLNSQISKQESGLGQELGGNAIRRPLVA